MKDNRKTVEIEKTAMKEKDEEAFRKLDHSHLASFCWFCDNRVDSQDYSIKKEMYRVVDKRKGKGCCERTKIAIPRCYRCFDNHKKSGDIPIICSLTVVVLLGVVLISLFGATMRPVIVLLAILGFIFGNWIGEHLTYEPSKAESHKNKYPLYKDLKSKGWKKRCWPFCF